MRWTIHKLYSPPVLRAVPSGMWDLSEFARMVDELRRQVLEHPYCSILIDDRALEWERVHLLEMPAVREIFAGSDHAFAHTRIAFLMDSIDDFVDAFRFQRNTQAASTAVLKIFYDESAALEWLTIHPR